MLPSQIKELQKIVPNELKTGDEMTRFEDPEYKIVQISEIKKQGLSKPKSTGFNMFDSILEGGIREGDLMIISGLSGRGKTHFSLQMIKHFSEIGYPVLLFSFEESMERINWRLGNMGCDKEILCFTPKKLKSGYVNWLEEKILDGLHNYFIKIIVIDNLDFLTAEKQNNQEDKWTLQSKIVAMLKRIAIENEVSILLNAHVKKLDETTPKMEDLYGSGDTYKLADFVVFVHRLKEKKKNLKDEPSFTNETMIIIEKNRLNGRLSKFKIEMRDNLFYELPRENQEG